MRRTVAIIAVLLLGAGQAAMAQGERMTGAELQALLGSGKTVALGGPGTGYSGELTLNADGTGSGSAKTDDGKNEFQLNGTWRIEGDQFCRTWEGVDDGKEVCEDWVSAGENKVNVMVDGKSVGVNSW